MPRRNDVVVSTRHDFWSPFGRVARTIDADTVEVAWGKDGIRPESVSTLEIHPHYRGYVDRGRSTCDPVTGERTYPHATFRRMPSLRRLKQAAISRGRGCWARDRGRFEAEKAEDEARWKAEDAVMASQAAA